MESKRESRIRSMTLIEQIKEAEKGLNEEALFNFLDDIYMYCQTKLEGMEETDDDVVELSE